GQSANRTAPRSPGRHAQRLARPSPPRGHRPGKPDGSGSPSRCPQTIQSLPPCSGPPLASHTSGPPQRASIPVLALEAQPPTGLPSRSTCRGAGPLQVLKTRGFEGDSRQAGPVRPLYNADQPRNALKGTGNQTLGPPSTESSVPKLLPVVLKRQRPRSLLRSCVLRGRRK